MAYGVFPQMGQAGGRRFAVVGEAGEGIVLVGDGGNQSNVLGTCSLISLWSTLY